MEDLATDSEWMDSEFILPDFPPDNNDDSNSKDEINLQTPLNPLAVDGMDTNVEIKEEVKVEVGELFTRGSDEQNDETVFPTGLILIHHQPTVNPTASDRRSETHLLSYTPVYMAENQTPSYLQMPNPNSSVIRTQNRDIQFVQQAIPPIPSGSARVSPRLHPIPRDSLPLKPERSARIRKEAHKCTSCGMTFITLAECNDHLKTAHKIDVRSKTEEKRYKCTLCELTFTLAERYDHVIAVHENQQDSHKAEKNEDSNNLQIVEGETADQRMRRLNAARIRRARERKRQSETPEQKKARHAANAERQRNRLANETAEHRKARLAADAERQRKYLNNENSEQRTARLAANLERQRKRLANETPEQRTKRLAADAERQRKYLANESPEERIARLGRDAERQRGYLANETPEQKAERLAANAERQRNYLANETAEQKAVRLASATIFVQCEYCEKSIAPRKLRYHMIRQYSKTEDKTFKCDLCEKTFAMQGDRKTHMLTHSKEKRFICDKCGKGYKDNSGLTNHIIFKHRFDEDVQEKYWQE